MITIIYILILIVGAVVILASRQPDVFSITRSAVVSALPSAVFAHVNNLRKWDAWSPWAKLDPNAHNSFSGPEEGVGAKMSWQGNGKVGEGSMTITDSVLPQRITFQLDFLKPMKATNTAIFTFTQEGSVTKVVWTMSGKHTPISKIMHYVINCDKMVGGQFEKGLADLKKIVEGKK